MVGVKKMSNWNLSEKSSEGCFQDDFKDIIYLEKDIKEFIKRLKEEAKGNCPNKDCIECKRIDAFIDKLAGEKLK